METESPLYKERYQAFIRNSQEGIWLVELDKPIPISLPPAKQIALMYRRAYLAEANNAMAAMYGVDSPAALIGMRLGELLVKEDPRNTAYLEAFISSGYSLVNVESHEIDHDGSQKVFRNSLVGILEGGLVLRAWGTQQDVTTQYQAEEALRKSEERLALALKASRMGMWEWNVQTGELQWSDELKLLYGLKPSDEVTYELYTSSVHPDDRARVRKIVADAMKTGREYRMEHRVLWKDGTVHWVLGQGKAILEDGKAVRMIGTSMGIDDIKRAEELKGINAVLQSESAQLLALNQSKDEFISLASHQLRTPATAVKQYTGMLLQGFSGPLSKAQRELLKIAYESNERQLEIIDDLLKVAQIDAGKVVLAKTKADIGAVVDDVVREQSSSFAARGQSIKFRRVAAPVHARADVRRLRMVLENLIDNAQKYSPEGAVTTISVREFREYVAISVKDQGVGIAKKDRERLFQKFSRVDNTFSTLVGGTGIGLYWAKKIIDLHNGTITIRSQVGKGSVFRITLPKQPKKKSGS